MILNRAALEEKRKEGHITPFGQNLRMDVTELDQGDKGNDNNGDIHDKNTIWPCPGISTWYLFDMTIDFVCSHLCSGLRDGRTSPYQLNGGTK